MNISIEPPLKLYRILQHPRRLTSIAYINSLAICLLPGWRAPADGKRRMLRSEYLFLGSFSAGSHRVTPF